MRLLLLAAGLVALGVPAAGQTCGDFVRDGLEQCDDGNLRNFDGCDASCRFEHTQRINGLLMEFNPGTGVCAANAIGGAIEDLLAGPAIQNELALDVSVGTISVLFQLMGLDDPAAADDPAVDVGVLNGWPVPTGSSFYEGQTSSDWWYAAAAGALDADRLPVYRLPGSISGGTLAAGPGRGVLRLVVAQTPTEMLFTGLNVSVPVGTATAPPASAGLAPGREPIEHLDPALQTVANLGEAGPLRGMLCGNVSAASLAATPFPLALLPPDGIVPCAEPYTTAHSFLDMLVGGCHSFGLIETIKQTQPDSWDPDAPVLGNGPPYSFAFDTSQYFVTGCVDRLFVEVPLQDCLAAAAYSSIFSFTTHRVLAAADPIFEDGFESGDLAPWSSASTDEGDLAVTGPGAIVGVAGLEGTIDDQNGLFVQDDRPEDESRYRARFHFDPAAFDPGEANGKFRTRIFIAFEDNPARRLVAVVLRRIGGQYSVMARVRQDNNSQVDTAFFPITPEPHQVEFEWVRSSGADAQDGQFRFWLDGALRSTVTTHDNSISSVDFARLGALSVKAGASGILRWDAFKATRRMPTVP